MYKPKEFVLRIQMDNAVFDDRSQEQIANILVDHLYNIRNTDDNVQHKIRDVNGNTVGSYVFTTDDVMNDISATIDRLFS